MLPPTDALKRCDELCPEVNLEIEQVSSTAVTIKKVPIEKWRQMLTFSLAYIEMTQELIGEWPDIEPFSELFESMDDLEALIHTLFICYDCTMREKD